MSELEQLIRRDLDQVVALPEALEPDWADIVRRSVTGQGDLSARGGERKRPAGLLGRLLAPARRRPLLVLIVLVVLALVPVSALAVAKSDPWWFLHVQGPLGFGPAQGSHVVVVKAGSWGGQDWVLTAYRSAAGLCYQVTLEENGKPSRSGGGTCGTVPGGVAETGNGRRRVMIGWMSGGLTSQQSKKQVRYIVGPVVSSATQVEITLRNGTVLHTSTFAAPKELGLAARFFAVSLPEQPPAARGHLTCEENEARQRLTTPARLIAVDSNGRTVATVTSPAGPPGFAAAFCAPHRNHFQLQPNVPAAGRQLRTVDVVTGPYHARARIAVGGAFAMTHYAGFPISKETRVVAPTRCWRVSFSNGQSQGTCVPLNERSAKNYFLDYLEIQHAGRDTFVIAQASPGNQPPVTRIALHLANGKVLSAKTVDGIAVFAIPADALSTAKSQRGFLYGYDQHGRQVSKRRAVYYRSCPPGSPCAGR